MKKDKKFLLELEQNLSSINKKKKDAIVLKYRNIIDEQIKEKKKIKDILKELGTPAQIAQKELELLNKNKKIDFSKIKDKTKNGIKKIYKGITKDIQINPKEKEEKIEEKELESIKIKKNKKIEDKKENKIEKKKLSKKEINKKVEEEDILIKERIKQSLERNKKDNSSNEMNFKKENKINKLKDKFKKNKKESILEENTKEEIDNKNENVLEDNNIINETHKKEIEANIEKKENKKKKKKNKQKSEENIEVEFVDDTNNHEDKVEQESNIEKTTENNEELIKEINEEENVTEERIDSKKESKIKKLKDKFKKKKEKNIFDEESNNQIEEICEITEIVSSKPVYMSKKDKTKRIVFEIIGILLITILLFLWMWVSVLFLASLFAYLDGIKLYGLSVTLLGLDVLMYWITIMINRWIFKKQNKYKTNLIIVISSVFVMAIGIALLIYQTSKLETESDVSQKYSMTTKYDTFSLPSNEKEKMYILFNSNYDTQYMVKYDEHLDGKFKMEVKYYENYYDYNLKKSSNNLYVSLSVDPRDRISAYIDDFKENKIYNEDELARYIVKITINEKDFQRLVIEN